MRAFPPENDHNNNDRRPHNHLLSALGDNGLGGMREAKTITIMARTNCHMF